MSAPKLKWHVWRSRRPDGTYEWIMQTPPRWTADDTCRPSLKPTRTAYDTFSQAISHVGSW